MNTFFKGIYITSFSAFLFGLNPLFVNLLQQRNFGVQQTLLIRFLGSFLVLLIIFKVKNKKIKLITNKKLLFKLLISSIFFLSTASLLIYSYTKIPTGLTTVLHFSYPVIITIMSIKAKRDKLNLALIISILISIIGVILVTNPTNIEFDLLGISSAFFSALTFAIYLFMINDKEVKKLDNILYVLYLSFISLILLLISFLFVDNTVYNLDNIDLDYITVLSGISLVIVSAIGVILFSYGARRVGGPIAGTLSSFEPLTAVFVGVFFLDEKSPKHYLIGVLFIITASIIISLFSSRGKKALS